MNRVMKGMLAKHQKNQHFKGVLKEISKENDKIVTYTAVTDFGYILKYIENKDSDSAYLDYADYTKFPELEVLKPHTSS